MPNNYLLDNDEEDQLSQLPSLTDDSDVGTDQAAAIKSALSDSTPAPVPAVVDSTPSKIAASAQALTPNANTPTMQDTYKRYTDLLNQINPESLKSAQDERRKNDALSMALLAGGQITQGAASMGGGKIGDNSAGANAVKAAGENKLKDLFEQQQMAKSQIGDMEGSLKLQTQFEMNDPGSVVSKAYQARAAAILKKLNPNSEVDLTGASAAQLEKLFGSNKGLLGGVGTDKYIRTGVAPDGHYVTTNMADGKQYKMDDNGNLSVYTGKTFKDTAVTDPETHNKVYISPTGKVVAGGVVPKGNVSPDQAPDAVPQEVDLNTLNKVNPKSYGEFNKVQDQMMKDKSVVAARQANNAATVLASKLNMLHPGDKVDSGMKAVIKGQLANLAQGGGHAAEGVINEFNGAGGAWPKLNRMVSENGPGVMTPEDLALYKTMTLKLQDAAAQNAQDSVQSYVDRVTKLPFGDNVKITPENARKLLSTENLTKNTSINQYNQQQGLVTVRGPSGQTVRMKKDKAQKYLSQPGYTLVEGQ